VGSDFKGCKSNQKRDRDRQKHRNTLRIDAFLICTDMCVCWFSKLENYTVAACLMSNHTTRPLSVTEVTPSTKAGRSSNSNSFASRAFSVRCTDRLKLNAGKRRQLGHLSDFQTATENSPFSLRHVKRSCHRAPLHFLSWRYTSFYHTFIHLRI